MPRTFADDLHDDMARVFLNPEHFAESFLHTNPVTNEVETPVTGILDEDEPVPGKSDEDGDRVIRTGILSIPATVTVSATPQKQSRFQRGAETWHARGISFEGDIQLVRVMSSTLTKARMGSWKGSQPR